MSGLPTDGEFEWIWEEAVVAWLKFYSRNFPGRIEGNYERGRSGSLVSLSVFEIYSSSLGNTRIYEFEL
jgi:hypothetical protein